MPYCAAIRAKAMVSRIPSFSSILYLCVAMVFELTHSFLAISSARHPWQNSKDTSNSRGENRSKGDSLPLQSSHSDLLLDNVGTLFQVATDIAHKTIPPISVLPLWAVLAERELVAVLWLPSLHRLGRLLFFRGVAARSQVSLPLCSSVLELVPAEASGHLPKPRRSPGAACRGFFFFEPVSWSSRLTNIRSAASNSTRDEIGGSSMSLSRRNILWHLLTRNWPVFSLRECSLAAKSACPPRWWVAGSQGWRRLTEGSGAT